MTCPGPSDHIFAIEKVIDTGTYALWVYKCRRCGVDLSSDSSKGAK
jgi:hypothetical protein